MLFAGIDIGSATSKLVVLDDGKQVVSSLIPTGGNVKKAAARLVRQSLSKHHLERSDIACLVATGYGRNAVETADNVFSEIICHARGACYFHPAPCSVVDIGGQDSKVIEIAEGGRVADFMMNDKCAAGTGRFLELIASVMNVKLDKLGVLSLQSNSPCPITSTCAVFAESEVISLRAEGRDQTDIIAGIHRSIAYRIKLMAQGLSLRAPVIFTGGVGRNPGMLNALQAELGMEVISPPEPQMCGALGAALLAQESHLNDAGEKTD